MKTELDCLPCLLKQALYTSRLCTDDRKIQKRVLDKVGRLLNSIDLDKTPPQNSIPVYEAIAEITGCPDPFLELKKDSNEMAGKMQDTIRRTIQSSDDPLMTALRFSMAGNIIDYGSQQDFDVDAAMENCLEETLAINHYEQLVEELQSADSILYLADNCGELLFDQLVIELLKQLGKTVTLAVKERPIINDALLEDASQYGLDSLCRVVSNGTGCPGTPLDLVSSEFADIFYSSEMIISKGQGNFETLSEISAPLFFLLAVKCPVVGNHIQSLLHHDRPLPGKGEMVLFKTPNPGKPECNIL
jgi:uncharacterized protein with ATP-grasp and redox domains